MTRDELIAIIYRTHAAPYGEYLPAGLRQQLTISAGLSTDTAWPLIEAHIEAEVKRRLEAEVKRRMNEVRKEKRPALNIEERNRRIQADYEAGHTLREIAQEHGIAYQRVHQILEKRGVEMRPAKHEGIPLNPVDVATSFMAGMTLTEIACSLGASTDSVRRSLERQGFRVKLPRMRFNSADERDAWIARSYSAGYSLEEIAVAVGVSSITVSKIVRNQGVEVRSKGTRVDHERDRRVAELYLQGRSLKEVAAEFGISQAGVSLALSRQGVKARPRHSRGGCTVTSMPTKAKQAQTVTPMPGRTAQRKAG